MEPLFLGCSSSPILMSVTCLMTCYPVCRCRSGNSFKRISNTKDMPHASLSRINDSTANEIRRFQIASITIKLPGSDQKPDRSYQVSDQHPWARRRVLAESLQPTFLFYTFGLIGIAYVMDTRTLQS